MSPRARLALALYATAGALYAIDRATKVAVTAALEVGESVPVLPPVLRLTHTENPAGACGLFGAQPWLFASVTALVTGVIVWASRKLDSRMSAVSLGIVLGGALGNLTDRLLRGPGASGTVIDFIDLHVWPVFNVADMGIVVGAGLMVLGGFLESRRDRRPREGPAAP